jgi:hypothetical protein
MRFANESYILGVPERLLRRAAKDLGWHIVAVDRQAHATIIDVRREMRVMVHPVVLPADMRRRHVVDAFRVLLRMKGA